MSRKVMAAMSGGVDSSVAAALLLEQGYSVCGATLKLFSNEDIGEAPSRTCCALTDVEDARRVAYKLGIEHFVFNFKEPFYADVIGRFAAGYRAGKTPNPCIDCNRSIKFDRLIDRAVMLGMDAIATGHYARVERDESTGRYLLKKAADVTKDQTYVLYMLTQSQLSRVLFPLGGFLKSEIREKALARGFVTADKPDSQDICFVPDGDYVAFLTDVMGLISPPGPMMDTAGNVLGTHRGLLHYTIGQRRGLNIGFGSPRYVVRKDMASNTLVIGEERDLYSADMTVGDVNFIAVPALKEPTRATVKTRYSQKETAAMLKPLGGDRVCVVFDAPQRAVTPGQAAVFYDGDTVLGGGTIL
ncbi:tRNA 2-thiouridine(34) synthase MnmA [Oscillospiraceae bacterium CM]|nr:tRNA 2-thiouridine(34) synthase MnmA [Oscillospiraceae bacterium CM]